MFKIESNYEFYCFLKAHLPKNYKIISEPSTEYYSEWLFNYKIYHYNELIEEIKGNFKDIKEGELVKKAKKILNGLTGGNDDNRE